MYLFSFSEKALLYFLLCPSTIQFSFCRPERDCPGPHEALKSKLKLKKILAKAASIQHTHIISFSDLRDDVKNELTCSAEVAGVRVSHLHTRCVPIHYFRIIFSKDCDYN